jgi:hypothetical protein
LPPVFAEHLQKVIPEGVPVIVLPCHINDEQFADALIEHARLFQSAAARPTE